MTYTPSKTTNGFEFNYNKSGFSANPVPYMLTPDVAFQKGQAVHFNPATGCIVEHDAANTLQIVGIMAESIEQADNPAAGETYGLVYDNPDNVYKVSFRDYLDLDATGGNVITYTTNSDLHAGLVGALIYVYEGPSAGSIRRISACDANDATVVLPFPEAITNESKAVVLGNNAGDGAINVGVDGVTTRDADDARFVDAQATPAAEGFLTVLSVDMENCTMDVMIQRGRHITG